MVDLAEVFWFAVLLQRRRHERIRVVERRGLGGDRAAPAKRPPCVHRVNDRRVISVILHVLRSGCRWHDCPPEYGPATTVCNRYNRWSSQGIWKRIFERLAAA
ncbi:transposase [Pseudoroseomonas wenyumeiae]